MSEQTLFEQLAELAEERDADVTLLVDGQIEFEVSPSLEADAQTPAEMEQRDDGAFKLAAVEQIRSANPDLADRIPEWHFFNYLQLEPIYHRRGALEDYKPFPLLWHNLKSFFPYATGSVDMENPHTFRGKFHPATAPTTRTITTRSGRSFTARSVDPIPSAYTYNLHIDTPEEIVALWNYWVTLERESSGLGGM